MKLITLTLAAMTGLGLCAAPLVLAEDDSFVGKWKFNPDKSQLNGLTYKVEQAGNGQYTFSFGDDNETLTLGKEHVTKYGNTWLITQSGPNAWKWVQKRNGKVFSDAMWTVLRRWGCLNLRQHRNAPGWFYIPRRNQAEADRRRDLRAGRHMGKHGDKGGLAYGNGDGKVGRKRLLHEESNVSRENRL
jgi:hypothetical protein